VAVRAPHLYPVLRAFVLGSFAYLGRALEEGEEIPLAFEEHPQRCGPTLYELRPLVRPFIEERAAELRVLVDAEIAIEELRREPAAAIFAQAHAGPGASEDDALFRTVLLALLTATAESCGGFDWDDEAFERAYERFEATLLAERRRYVAIAPLVGLSLSKPSELAPGLMVRLYAAHELSGHWPEARGLLPPLFGRELDRTCVVELRRDLAAREEPPDAPAEVADAVTALRLVTGAALAAGPVLFELLDGRPFGIRPALPIAATQPLGEPSRLDALRAPIAAEAFAALGEADGDPALAEALDRWELSLFQNEPFRSEQLRAALAALLGETWPMRCAVLLEEPGVTREELHRHLVALAEGSGGSAACIDAARRALVAVLREGDRRELLNALDRELLGVRRRRAPLPAAQLAS
jgi:hypothetical protein